MRFDGKTNKQRIDQLKLNKLSNVGTPAQGPALASIVKTADAMELSKQTFIEVMAEIELDAATSAIVDKVWDMSGAIRRSVNSIITDISITNKKETIKQNVAQFMAAMTNLIDSSSAIKGMSELDIVKAVDVEQIPKDFIEDAAKFVDPESGDFIPKDKKDKKDKKQKSKGGKKMDVTKENFDKIQEQLDKTVKVAQLNDAEKAHMATLKEDDQSAFLDMEMDARKELITKAATKVADEIKKTENDESIVANGATIKKSEVGEGVFAFIKAQQTENEATKAELAKEKETRIQKELETEACGLWPNSPGSAADKATMLKSIRTLPEASQKSQLEMLKAADATYAQSFTEIGHNNTEVKKGEDALDSLAKTFQEKDPTLTKAQAYKAAMMSAKGQEIYKEMRDGSSLH